MSKSFCLLDDSMTLHGLRFLPEGGDMSRFQDNPILLYMHIRGTVHGKWNDIRLEDGKWLAVPEFDEEDPESAKIAGKVNRGFLKACSMGVFPLEVKLIDGEPWAVKWLALECSIVDAGSNANALRLYGADGEVIEDTVKHILNLTIPLMKGKNETGNASEETETVVPGVIALAAGLAENATEEAIAAKVKEIVDENKSLKLAAQTDKTKQIKDFLDQAVLDKKISATERENYETLSASNFDAVKAIVGKLKAPVDLTAFAKGGQNETVDDEDLAKKYNELDKAGKLYALKAKNPEQFKAMYSARFNKPYTGQ